MNSKLFALLQQKQSRMQCSSNTLNLFEAQMDFDQASVKIQLKLHQRVKP